MSLLLSLALLGQPADACPTIATGTPSQLSFDTAQVAITHQDGRTTFSVSINPLGEQQEFALVLPVPEVLEEHEIRTLDPEIFARLNGYTAPRRVDDAGCAPAGGGTDADDGGDGGESEAGVDIEAEYIIGEYLVIILSAEESAGLQTWLDDNGYYLPEGAGPRLEEYIEAGSYFLAAKVHEDAAVASGEPLSPLQISYESEIFSIPIRLAALSSPGEQDMVIYALTPQSGPGSGRVGISNYSEFEVPDRCIWREPADSSGFSGFYEDHFTRAWTEVGQGAWTVEFAGGPYDCNPCTDTWITEEDLAELGFNGSYDSHHLTRIRMRYTQEQAGADLTLYGSGIYEPEVTSFADDNEMNRGCIEYYCDGSPVGSSGGDDGGDDGGGDGGTIDEGDGGSEPDGVQAGDSNEIEESSRCGAVGGGGVLAVIFGLLGIAGRRRV